MATTVSNKGGTGRFARDKCLDFIRECRDQEIEILLKSDQEAGVEFVIEEIVDARTERRTIDEGAPSSE
eukprot:12429052-Karenia_brevis.AAC.1